jgi:hypothetical protein
MADDQCRKLTDFPLEVRVWRGSELIHHSYHENMDGFWAYIYHAFGGRIHRGNCKAYDGSVCDVYLREDGA